MKLTALLPILHAAISVAAPSIASAEVPNAAANVDSAVTNLLAWLSHFNNPAFDASSVRISRGRGGSRGLGLIAERALRPGDLVVQVPAAAMLTPAAALQDPELGPLLVDLDLDARLLLVVLLLRERSLVVDRDGDTDETGRFASYLSFLEAQRVAPEREGAAVD